MNMIHKFIPYKDMYDNINEYTVKRSEPFDFYKQSIVLYVDPKGGCNGRELLS